ncbi:1-deoxy-D-xylulose-5-phosphate reductoisomerase [Candidatus Pelagibacter sp. FZCC0015]|uniref:1-deoxy-D-xylulose-5-phosphate reductoisomerase n=1 Tax=Candidatus Pelagibacter sp. FZCC0015 TaxID=2268451 RepID=UPI00119CC3FB|nr:1-deoxy-D-xylulose-5-phosphate reductoisomerase [Candidatus Pelagibacter sp. FZCC0015]
MKKKIAILGSTGSIGRTLLKIIQKDKKNFEIKLLTANKNYKLLLSQAKNFKVKNIIITDFNCYLKLKKLNKNKNINIYKNFNNLDKILNKKIDYTMSSIVGLDGLLPTIKIIKFTKSIAVANKEAIICGWNLIKNELIKNKTTFLPVDSEHYSIWEILNLKYFTEVEKIYITASGGPFLKTKYNEIKKVKIHQALKHPNWKMGKKISIDSATMMNKVFEVIETKNIFNIPYKRISILVHPISYVHAMIKFKNGIIKILAHETSMRIPIFNTLYHKMNQKINSQIIDIKKLNNLELETINKKKFPMIEILNLLPLNSSLFETILVVSNDFFVNLFLNKKIKFYQIPILLLKFLKIKEFQKYKSIKPKKIQDIIELSNYVRLKLKSLSI